MSRHTPRSTHAPWECSHPGSIATPSHSSMLWTDASSACGQPASSGTTEWGSTGS